MRAKLLTMLTLRAIGLWGLLLSGCCNEAELPKATLGLYSANVRERTEALHALSRCGASAEPSVQRIAALMYDGNVGVASAAAYALRKIDSKQAREALSQAEAMRERNRQIRQARR